MVKVALIILTLIMELHQPLNTHVTVLGRLENPQLVKGSDAAVEATEGALSTEDEYLYYEPLMPVYEDERAVSVHCEEWELEELARLAYLEAGADWMSDDCIRAVVEVVFNQLQYGAWGNTLHDVIFSAGNYEPAYNIPYTEPSARCREIVHTVYHEGIRIPARVMFFRAWYYHQWDGAIPEFEIDGVYFSSSWWCQ